VDIPKKAVAHAAKQNMAADEFWCLELVEKTGIVCVPGSGFGQEPGTFHFRITILPAMKTLESMLVMLKEFQMAFQSSWSSGPSPAPKTAKHHLTRSSGPRPSPVSAVTFKQGCKCRESTFKQGCKCCNFHYQLARL
jgi:hypothetical protein